MCRMDKPSPSPEKTTSASREAPRAYEPKYDISSVDVDTVDWAGIKAVGDGVSEVDVHRIIAARTIIQRLDSKDRAAKAAEIVKDYLFSDDLKTSPKYASKVDRWREIAEQSLTCPDSAFDKRVDRWLNFHLDRYKGEYPVIDAEGKKDTKIASEAKVSKPTKDTPEPAKSDSSKGTPKDEGSDKNESGRKPDEKVETEKKGKGKKGKKNPVEVDISDLSDSERAALFGGEDDPDLSDDESNPTIPGRSAERVERERQLERLRHWKDMAFAEKVKAPVYRRGAREEARRRFQEAQEAYNVELEKDFDAKVLEKASDASVSDAELKKFIEDSANQLGQAEHEAQHREVVAKYGKLGTALEWYSNLSGSKKILYGAGIGLAAAALGIGIGAIGGVVGTGVAAAGSAYGIARRGTSQYFTHFSNIFKSTEADKFTLGTLSREDMKQQAGRLMRQHLEAANSEAIVNAEAAKKKAVKYGLGAAALVGGGLLAGGILGAVLHVNNVDIPSGHQPHWNGGKIKHSINDRFGPKASHTIPYPSVRESVAPPQPTFTTKEVLDVNSYIDSHEASLTVSRGEGWYQTFKELGMSSEERQAFLKEHGEALLNMRDEQGRAIAYRMKNGDIGISRPGGMSRSVLEYITEQAHSDGYIDVSTKTISVPDPVAQPTSTFWLENARTITPNESVANTLTEFKNAGVIDSTMAVQTFDTIVQQAGDELSQYSYPNGTPVVYKTLQGEWRFNLVNGGNYAIPEEVLKKLREAALRNHYTLAA